MDNNIHRGTELNNVKETWDQNEKARAEGSDAGRADVSTGGAEESELQRVIHEEAAAYDNDNKEDRVLGGERATVNDDDAGA